MVECLYTYSGDLMRELRISFSISCIILVLVSNQYVFRRRIVESKLMELRDQDSTHPSAVRFFCFLINFNLTYNVISIYVDLAILPLS